MLHHLIHEVLLESHWTSLCIVADLAERSRLGVKRFRLLKHVEPLFIFTLMTYLTVELFMLALCSVSTFCTILKKTFWVSI